MSAVASGLTYVEAGGAIGVSSRTVARWLSEPEAQEIVSRLRRTFRASVSDTAQLADPLIRKALLSSLREAKINAKDVDALTRSLLNLEKVSASASGENIKKNEGNSEIRVIFPQWAQRSPVIETVAQVVDVTPLSQNTDSEPVVPSTTEPGVALARWARPGSDLEKSTPPTPKKSLESSTGRQDESEKLPRVCEAHPQENS